MSNRSLWFLVVRQLMDTELTSDVALNLSTMSTHELIKCATRKLRISQTFDYSPASLPRIDRYDIVLKIPHPNPSGPLSSSPHSDHFVTPTFMNISLIPGGKWLVAVCCVDEARYLACWDIHPVTPDTNDTNSALSTPILPTAFVALDRSGENPRLKLAHILCDSMWRADQDRLLVLVRPSEDLGELYQWDCKSNGAFVRVASTLSAHKFTSATLARISDEAFLHSNDDPPSLWNWRTSVLAPDIQARYWDDQQHHQFTSSGAPFRIFVSLDTGVRLSIKFTPLRVSGETSTVTVEFREGSRETLILDHLDDPKEIAYLFEEASEDKLYVSWFPAIRVSSENIILCFRVHYTSSPFFFISVSNDVRPQLLLVTTTLEEPLADSFSGFWINSNWTFAIPNPGTPGAREPNPAPAERSHARRSSTWRTVRGSSAFALVSSAKERLLGSAKKHAQSPRASEDDTKNEHIVALRPFGLLKRIASFPAQPDDAGTRITKCEGFCGRSGTMVFRKQWADDSESFVILKYD